MGEHGVWESAKGAWAGGKGNGQDRVRKLGIRGEASLVDALSQ